MGSRIGAITFGGLSSGIPTAEIIDKLLDLQHRPIDILEDKKSNFEKKLAVYQDLNSKTRALRDLLRGLDNMNLLGTDASARDEFSRYTSTSSNSLIATATTDSSSSPGSFTFRVNQLATEERTVTQGYSALTDTIDNGDGTASIDITVNGTTETINLDTTNNTLSGFVAAVNALDLDVRAFIINDGSASNPYRIAIQGTKTGSDYAITIAPTSLDGGTATPVFTETQAAQDAQITVDPGANEFTVLSTTNTFSNVVDGLTVTAISAQGSSDTPITVTVSQDADAITSEISAVVSKYNEIIDTISEQFEVDPTTNRGGVLIGDSTLVSLQRRLGSTFASSIGSGTITAGIQVGLELDKDGKLQLDESKLKATLASDPTGVKDYFAGSNALLDKLRTVANSYIDVVDGLLTTRIQGASTSIQGLADDITDAEDRLDTIEANLVREFAALERAISGIQAQGNFLSQFLLANR